MHVLVLKKLLNHPASHFSMLIWAFPIVEERHKESAPWVQCLSRDSVAERSKAVAQGAIPYRTPPLSFCVTWAATETAKGPAAQLLFLHTGMRSQCAAVSRPLQAALSSRWARVVGAAQRLSTIVCGGCWEGMGSFCYLCAQVPDLQSRDSSVGRASDWRSEGPRLDPGSRQLLIIHMVGNSLGLRKLGRDDLGDFSFKKNNACSSVEKTAKSSRLAFLNVDLGLSYCRRET